MAYLLASFIASMAPVPMSPPAINIMSALLDIIWLAMAFPFAWSEKELAYCVWRVQLLFAVLTPAIYPYL